MTMSPMILTFSQRDQKASSRSVGFTDHELWRTVEPGTPAPDRRLDVVRTLNENGIGCGVLMAPVIPFLSDHPSQLRATVRTIAVSGATSVTPLVLHLRPGAREWFMSRLEHHHPHLVRRHERLYAEGTYAPKWHQRRITRQVHEPAQEYGIGPTRTGMPRRVPDRSLRRPYRGPLDSLCSDATFPAPTGALPGIRRHRAAQ